jgi:hypothetical protein
MIDYSKIEDVAIIVADTRESEAAQKVLFSLGCYWEGESTQTIQHQDRNVLYVYTTVGKQFGAIFHSQLDFLGIWFKCDTEKKLILAFTDKLAENLLKLGDMKKLAKPCCEGKVVEIEGVKYRLKKID